MSLQVPIAGPEPSGWPALVVLVVHTFLSPAQAVPLLLVELVQLADLGLAVAEKKRDMAMVAGLVGSTVSGY